MIAELCLISPSGAGIRWTFARPNAFTQVSVIAGGPCSGKTALVRALAERGHRTVPETAEETIRAAVEAGVPVEQQRLTDPVGFQGRCGRKYY